MTDNICGLMAVMASRLKAWHGNRNVAVVNRRKEGKKFSMWKACHTEDAKLLMMKVKGSPTHRDKRQI